MLVLKSSFTNYCPTNANKTDANYIALISDQTNITIEHELGEYPLVEVYTIEDEDLAEAFSFDSFTTDAFSGNFSITEIDECDYTLSYNSENEINLVQSVAATVYIIVRRRTWQYPSILKQFQA